MEEFLPFTNVFSAADFKHGFSTIQAGFEQVFEHCLTCTKSLTKRQKAFCSANCRTKAWWSQNKAQVSSSRRRLAPPPKLCKVCGVVEVPLNTGGGVRREYCSTRCKNRQDYLNRKAARA